MDDPPTGPVPEVPTAQPASTARHGVADDEGQSSSGLPRRWVLAGGVAVIAGAGLGVGARFVQSEPDRRRALPRRAASASDTSTIEAALAAEIRLIADLDATTGGDADIRRAVVQIRADHAAHVAALRAELFDEQPAAPTRRGHSSSASGSTAPTASPGVPLTVAGLRAAESGAAVAAARRAAHLAGARAALLASISAAESAHAELFG